jgi:Raf kinase inhibitor-like YbhB/YbcL family protein
MRFAPLLAALALAALAGSAQAGSDKDLAIRDPGLKAAVRLKVSSPAIAPGGAIAQRFTSYGQGVSPPLVWSGAPAATRAFALIIEDPDAPTPQPFVHWLVWDIPARTASIAEGTVPAGARQGRLMYVGKVGYVGPRPPPGGPHHYHIQVFALDQATGLPDGADRAALARAMRGHVLASGELVATYQHKQ